MATGGENPTNIIDSEEAFDFECGPCKLDDKALPAKGYCSDCAEYLCDVCFNIHCRPMPSRHHVLLDTDAMPKHVVRKSTVNMSTETCTKHPGKMIEYFCPSHDFLGCSACITMAHRSCHGVLYIPDEIDTFYHSEEYEAFKSSLVSEETRIKDIIDVVDDANAKSESLLFNTKQKIKSFRKNVDQIMDNNEKKLEDKAVLLDKQNSDILKMVSAEFTVQVDFFQSVVSQLEEQERSQQAHASFITMKKSKQDIVSYRKQFSKTRCRLYELTSFSFKPLKSSDIEKIITTFGEIVRFYDAVGISRKIWSECNMTFPADVTEDAFEEHQLSHIVGVCPVCKMMKNESMSDDDFARHVNNHYEEDDGIVLDDKRPAKGGDDRGMPSWRDRERGRGMTGDDRAPKRDKCPPMCDERPSMRDESSGKRPEPRGSGGGWRDRVSARNDRPSNGGGGWREREKEKHDSGKKDPEQRLDDARHAREGDDRGMIHDKPASSWRDRERDRGMTGDDRAPKRDEHPPMRNDPSGKRPEPRGGGWRDRASVHNDRPSGSWRDREYARGERPSSGWRDRVPARDNRPFGSGWRDREAARDRDKPAHDSPTRDPAARDPPAHDPPSRDRSDRGLRREESGGGARGRDSGKARGSRRGDAWRGRDTGRAGGCKDSASDRGGDSSGGGDDWSWKS